MITEEIKKDLFSMQDIKYRDFQSKLFPTVDPESVIGVRTPELKAYAKKISKREDIGHFLEDLPHEYFDENQLHAFIISEIKDFEACMERVDLFLPYVDNWATCDQMKPKAFKKHKAELVKYIDKWIASEETYTKRFGIKMLMDHFLDEDFDIKYALKVSGVRSEEYYVNMMIAWYFATALSKQYEAVLPIIEEKKLPARTHNKAIQKSVESLRITDEQKEYLKSLKIK